MSMSYAVVVVSLSIRDVRNFIINHHRIYFSAEH